MSERLTRGDIEYMTIIVHSCTTISMFLFSFHHKNYLLQNLFRADSAKIHLAHLQYIDLLPTLLLLHHIPNIRPLKVHLRNFRSSSVVDWGKTTATPPFFRHAGYSYPLPLLIYRGNNISNPLLLQSFYKYLLPLTLRFRKIPSTFRCVFPPYR